MSPSIKAHQFFAPPPPNHQHIQSPVVGKLKQESLAKLILVNVLQLHLKLTVNSVYNVQIEYSLQVNASVSKKFQV